MKSPGHELAGVVDEEAAIGVAVVGDPEVGPGLPRALDDELAVLGEERVRLVVREGSVGLEVAADGVDRQPLEHGREHRPGHPVRGVDHDPERLDGVLVDEREHLLDEPRPRCPPREPRRAGRRGRLVFIAHKLEGAVAHVEEARLAADRKRAGADDLHPRVLLGVVRGGDADAAVEPELADGEIDHLRADEAEVEHVRAGIGRAVDQRARPSRARRPACRARPRSSCGSNCSTYARPIA